MELEGNQQADAESRKTWYAGLASRPYKTSTQNIVDGVASDLSTRSDDIRVLALQYIPTLPSSILPSLVRLCGRDITTSLSAPAVVCTHALQVVVHLLLNNSFMASLAGSQLEAQVVEMWGERMGALLADQNSQVCAAAFAAIGKVLTCAPEGAHRQEQGATGLRWSGARRKVVEGWMAVLRGERVSLLHRLPHLAPELQQAAIPCMALAARVEEVGWARVRELEGLAAEGPGRVLTPHSGLGHQQHHQEVQEMEEGRRGSQGTVAAAMAQALRPALASLHPPLILEACNELCLLVEAGAPDCHARAASAALQGLLDHHQHHHHTLLAQGSSSSEVVLLLSSSCLLGGTHAALLLIPRLLRGLPSLTHQPVTPSQRPVVGDGTQRDRATATALITAAALTLIFQSKGRKLPSEEKQAVTMELLLGDVMGDSFPAVCREEIVTCFMEMYLRLMSSYQHPSCVSKNSGGTRSGNALPDMQWVSNWAQVGIDLAEVGKACLRWGESGNEKQEQNSENRNTEDGKQGGKDTRGSSGVYVTEMYLRLVSYLCSCHLASASVPSSPPSVSDLISSSITALLISLLRLLPHLNSASKRRRILWLLAHHFPFQTTESGLLKEVMEMAVSATHQCLLDLYASARSSGAKKDKATSLGCMVVESGKAPLSEAQAQREVWEVVVSTALCLIYRCPASSSLLRPLLGRHPPPQDLAKTPAFQLLAHKVTEQLNSSIDPHHMMGDLFGTDGESFPLSSLHSSERPSSHSSSQRLENLTEFLRRANIGSMFPSSVFPPPQPQDLASTLTIDSELREQLKAGEKLKTWEMELCGSGDPVQVTVHVVKSPDRKCIQVGMRILNLTEVTLSPLAVRVGTSATISVSFPQQSLIPISSLQPQESAEHQMEFTVDRISCCSIYIQVLFASGKEQNAAEADSDGVAFNPSRPSESTSLFRSAPVTLRCEPVHLPLVSFISPHPLTPGCFAEEWNRCTGSGEVEVYGVHHTEAAAGSTSVEDALQSWQSALSSAPLFRTSHTTLPACGSFQECYCGTSWFGERILLMVFGYVGRSGGQVWCKCILRSPSETLLEAIAMEKPGVLSQLTQDAVSTCREVELSDFVNAVEVSNSLSSRIALNPEVLQSKILDNWHGIVTTRG